MLHAQMTRAPHPIEYVFTFAQGDRSKQDLLGGKGANLAEMTRLGLPVPPGFTITTEACRYFLKHGEMMTPKAALATIRQFEAHAPALMARLGKVLFVVVLLLDASVEVVAATDMVVELMMALGRVLLLRMPV